MTPPEGNAGWTKDEKGFLAYETHDIWLLAADGKTATKLTSGTTDGTVHRIVRLGATDEGVDLLAPVYLSLTGKLSKKSGYGRLTSGKSVERLVYDSARVIRLMKADSAEVLAFTRERFNDAPDWYVGGPLLRDPQQVTNFMRSRPVLPGASRNWSISPAPPNVRCKRRCITRPTTIHRRSIR